MFGSRWQELNSPKPGKRARTSNSELYSRSDSMSLFRGGFSLFLDHWQFDTLPFILTETQSFHPYLQDKIIYKRAEFIGQRAITYKNLRRPVYFGKLVWKRLRGIFGDLATSKAIVRK